MQIGTRLDIRSISVSGSNKKVLELNLFQRYKELRQLKFTSWFILIVNESPDLILLKKMIFE